MIDPIADLLTQIRNKNMVYANELTVPYSDMKWAIVNLLREEGFIEGCQIMEPSKKEKTASFRCISIVLKYARNRRRVISGLRRISKPGRRTYVTVDKLRSYRREFGVTFLSTQKGVLTDKMAYRERVGGEVLCTVW